MLFLNFYFRYLLCLYDQSCCTFYTVYLDKVKGSSNRPTIDIYFDFKVQSLIMIFSPVLNRMNKVILCWGSFLIFGYFVEDLSVTYSVEDECILVQESRGNLYY